MASRYIILLIIIYPTLNFEAPFRHEKIYNSRIFFHGSIELFKGKRLSPKWEKLYDNFLRYWSKRPPNR